MVKLQREAQAEAGALNTEPPQIRPPKSSAISTSPVRSVRSAALIPSPPPCANTGEGQLLQRVRPWIRPRPIPSYLPPCRSAQRHAIRAFHCCEPLQSMLIRLPPLSLLDRGVATMRFRRSRERWRRFQRRS